jgi:hypothetical protein
MAEFIVSQVALPNVVDKWFIIGRLMVVPFLGWRREQRQRRHPRLNEGGSRTSTGEQKMKKPLLLSVCVAVVAVMVVQAQARPFLAPNVSCQGDACDGGNTIRDYVYELHQVDPTFSNLRSFSVGVLDPGGISNILGPDGWTADITAANPEVFDPLTDGVFTEHGTIAPESWQSAPYVITWTAPGDGILPSEWSTLQFGFDDPNRPVNVTWASNFSSGGTYDSVAGGVGAYSYGPVHTPIPEPSTAILVIVAAISLIARISRRR